MDQDGTWYRGRPGPSDVVLDGDPVPPKRCTAPSFRLCLLWPNGWMDEDATWSPGHAVLDDDPASPLRKGTADASLRPMSIVATVAHLSYC